MRCVVDASAVVAALVDDGPDGRWAASVMSERDLHAPHLMPVEVVNVLRRARSARSVGDAAASLAFEDLLNLRVTLYPFQLLAERVWELREHVTAYDAWYVALAEAIDADLVTLDMRLAHATGPRCMFLTP